MKIFFRKHGNSLLYIILPLAFLVLTIGFIQFTPKMTQSQVGGACDTEADCDCPPGFDTSAGCGVIECEAGECVYLSLYCDDGTATITPNGCFCEDDNGDLIPQQDCQQCPGETIWNPATGTCVTVPAGGAEVEGSGVLSCANLAGTMGNPSAVLLPFSLGVLGLGMLRRFKK